MRAKSPAPDADLLAVELKRPQRRILRGKAQCGARARRLEDEDDLTVSCVDAVAGEVGLFELEGTPFTNKPERLLVRFFLQRHDHAELAHETASSPTWLGPDCSLLLGHAGRHDQDRAAGDADEAVGDAPEER